MNYNILTKRLKVGVSVLLLLFVAGLMIMSSCSRSKLEEDINRLMGKKIFVPYDSLLNYRDVNVAYLDSCQYRYVVYFDSTVCSSCTLKNMYYWEVLRDSIATLGKRVDLVFIYSPSREETGKFLNDLRHAREELISFVDTTGCFIRKNSFIPENSNIHAFLLDSNNRIIMVGNAQNNPAIEKLFFNIIHKSDEI